MTVPTRLHRTTRSRLARSIGRIGGGVDGPPAMTRPSAEAEPAPGDESAPQARELRAGGPDDRALYHCHCGFVFEAAVTASVGCPHCGSAQAW